LILQIHRVTGKAHNESHALFLATLQSRLRQSIAASAGVTQGERIGKGNGKMQLLLQVSGPQSDSASRIKGWRYHFVSKSRTGLSWALASQDF
jgi:hypothetical protein